MRVHVFGLAIALAFAGCQWDPFTEVYTTKRPKPEDLVGVYVLTEATNAFIAKEGNYPKADSSITLRADGTITMANIPDWWLTDFGKPEGELKSHYGRWTVEKHQEWWVVYVSLQKVLPAGRYSPEMGTDLFLIGEKPPYTIHLIIGDPDQGRGMDFVRTKT